MSYPYPGEDILEGLDATPAERLAFHRVLDEVEAEEAAGQDPPPDPDGPWRDFNAAAGQMDQAHAADAARLAEDVADQIPDRRPPSAEDKLARAMGRIERGTYTAPPSPPGPAARDAGGRFRQTCGDADDLGYCTERYHQAGCHVITEGAAATGSATEAEAWAATLRGYTQPPGVQGYAAGLASPSDPGDTFADLLSGPGRSDQEVHQRMLAELGETEPGPDPFPREQYPPVADLRTALGL